MTITHIEAGNQIIRCDQIALVAFGSESPAGTRGVDPIFTVRVWMFGDTDEFSLTLSDAEDGQASDFLGLYRRFAGLDRSSGTDRKVQMPNPTG